MHISSSGFLDEPKFTLRYETREKSENFLESIDLSQKEDNIDFWFICNAYEAAFTYFVPDQHKDGGKYVNRRGFLKKVDPIEQVIVLTDGCIIPINSITEIEIE